MKKWKIARTIGLILGLVFFSYWLGKIGPMVILNYVLELKWWALALFLNSFLWYLLYTEAWRNYFANLTHNIPFFHLLKIKICGEAVNLMTPLGFVAGDPVRVLMLQKQLGQSARSGSVLVDRTLHTLASVLFVFTGLLITFTQGLEIPALLRWSLLGGYFLLVLLVAFFTMALFKGRGVKIVHSLLVKLGLEKRLVKFEVWISDLNEELSSFSGGNKGPFVAAFFYHFGGRILGAVEISLIFLYLVGEPQFIFSIILASLTSIIHLLFTFVPGAIGILESMYGGFFYFYGLSPDLGISMQIIRRIRALFWIGVGLILINAKKGKKKG